MNQAKLRIWVDNPTVDQQAFFDDLLTRLNAALGDWLSVEECQALYYVFLHHTLMFDDGFSTDSPFFDGIGDYCAVASCFSRDPSYDWNAVKLDFDHTEPTGRFGQAINRLLSKLKCYSTIS